MICPDCKKEFDPVEEAAKYEEIVLDYTDWYWRYSGHFCAECDMEEARNAEGGLLD